MSVLDPLNILKITQKAPEQTNTPSKSPTATNIDDDKQFASLLTENDNNIRSLSSPPETTMDPPPQHAVAVYR